MPGRSRAGVNEALEPVLGPIRLRQGGWMLCEGNRDGD